MFLSFLFGLVPIKYVKNEYKPSAMLMPQARKWTLVDHLISIKEINNYDLAKKKRKKVRTVLLAT